ncbi:MAG: triose-phosphate isomerase [Nanoarchaeota archaeon]
MRKKIFVGNWKMYKSPAQAKELAKALLGLQSRHEVVVCPPYVSLPAVSAVIKKSLIKLGAQNMYFEESGAYTGEISPLMLKEVGVSHILLGHSERRTFFGETNAMINRKMKLALDYHFTPILCIGETAHEKGSHITDKVLERQLREGLKGITKSGILSSVIAYEPIWAISRGDPDHKAATPEDAEAAHRSIRSFISRLYDKEVGQKVRIIYGGSVKPENIDALMAKKDVDGVLPGGASLDAKKFIRIVNYETPA